MARGVAVLSCAPDESQPGTLGNGSFSYNCASAQDPNCPSPLDLDSRPFPSAVAFGARFELTYTPKFLSSFPNVAVQTASSDFFSVEQNVFIALRVGTPWFVALADNGSVLDLTSVTIEPVASILVSEVSTSLNPNVPGSTHTFAASAQGALGQSLAGDIPCI